MREGLNPETAVVAGSFFHLGFAVFHLFFGRVFSWREDLASLTAVNRAVMQVLNLCLTFVFLVFAYVSAFQTAEITSTSLGRALLALIALFWLLRTIEQVVFFTRSRLSAGFCVIFLLGALLYGYAWAAA